MKAKTLFLMALVAILAACNSNNPEQNKLIGTWQVDSIGPLGVMVNQNITFDKTTLTYYIGPDGDEMWGGESKYFNYIADSKKLIITAQEPYSYSFQTDYVVEKDTILYIERFSLDGNNYFRLRLHKK